MNILSILVAFSAVVSGELIADELCAALAFYSDRYPDHACAMFRNKPETSHAGNLPGTWVWKHFEHWSANFPYYVCIKKSNRGDWVERTGDGGFYNWCYNAGPFIRTNDRRLTVI
ncbi:hypothetical protein DSO57_1038190 [Entomophthora muscae]|uniref:Uncharacterized protein n=1 Tax=Entomophthora muscae TaxID=34485 RepID=A0ACC2RDG3_9FUNG|nr:hypothetical protein DSO57_1038190 [Entomophthora muscae]